MTVTVKIESNNPFRRLKKAIGDKGMSASCVELRSIAEEMVRDVRAKILNSEVPWGEGVDAAKASKQLADSVYYTVEGNNVIIGVSEGTHTETGLPYVQIAKMREIGTSVMEMSPAFTPAFRRIQMNKKEYARRIGRRAARSMR